MNSLELLKKYCEAFGPSSAESHIRSVIQETLQDSHQFITTTHGHLIAFDPEAKGDKTIMFQAHMDELGFRPYRYMSDGYIELSPASPIPENASNQLLIFFPNMVLGILVIDKQERQHRYFLDIGAQTKEEALERIPTYSNGAYKGGEFHETPNFLCGKSFDDRAGCAVVSNLLLNQPRRNNRVIGVYTVREESGNWPIPELRYALLEAGLKPDLVVNVEVCPGGPTPLGVEPLAILGQGVALTHMDLYYISDSSICQFMVQLARKEKIKHQHMSERSGGGELGAICNELGVTGYSLVIPGRYMHSPHSVISRNDYETAIEMVHAIARSGDILRK
ncbi:hypothetical protein ACFL27_01675 [candidate division CSSED10-310 bacterium]|uniref:M42 family peptidase n=1 Tax=candidate division CSSED10-310 bacterium TaxID=2855610 RepID=A0ABV6YRS2_UNCC1